MLLWLNSYLRTVRDPNYVNSQFCGKLGKLMKLVVWTHFKTSQDKHLRWKLGCWLAKVQLFSFILKRIVKLYLKKWSSVVLLSIFNHLSWKNDAQCSSELWFCEVKFNTKLAWFGKYQSSLLLKLIMSGRQNYILSKLVFKFPQETHDFC